MPLADFTQARGLKNWWAGSGGLKDQLNLVVDEVNTLVASGLTNNTSFAANVQSSAVDINLSTLLNVNSITMTASSKTVTLPSASGESTVYDGGIYGFYNAGAEAFDIDDNGASLIYNLPAGQAVIIGCTDDTTAAGGWVILSTYLRVGTDVQAYDADTLKADTADTLTAGFNVTDYDAGTKSTGTYTPDPADGNQQYAVNNGAHTLAPPASSCTMVVQYTNGASAGAVTTSGFTRVDGAFTTTNGDDFLCYITVCNSFSYLNIVALQ